MLILLNTLKIELEHNIYALLDNIPAFVYNLLGFRD